MTESLRFRSQCTSPLLHESKAGCNVCLLLYERLLKVDPTCRRLCLSRVTCAAHELR